ncbi:MAG: N-acetyltransferase [Candidatus Omnitrophica bacterium]|nr:N-acetyltransferase [Candidatus Omnitrophota bacterium]
MIIVRQEKKEDIEAVRQINLKAFARPQEADIVDKLRDNCQDCLSLVAEVDGNIAGHILFSPAIIEADSGVIKGMGLAPMAVLPAYQKQGIGSALVQDGLEKLKQVNCSFVIVLGHSEYYPKFGFKAASSYGIKCEWEVPDEAFMAIVLDELKMQGVSGVAKYRPEFAEAV